MLGDGDPLLRDMEQALIDLADARAHLATASLDVLSKTAELNRLQAQQTALHAAATEADKAGKQAEADAKTRQTWIDALTTGDLKDLVTDAGTALGAEATARTRVEGEFPSNTVAPEKDFLTRVRARRALAADSLKQASTVEGTLFTAEASAVAKARRSYDAAVDAVRQAFQAAPRLAADGAVLARLAALPAAHLTTPISYPILTVWQHDRLHDTTKKTNRENALAKLKDVDDAAAAVRIAQAAYDTALHAAMAADPDKTQAELDAGVVKPKKDDVVAKKGTLDTKRGAMTVDEIKLVKAWLAAVPDKLWDALDQLDTAASRLHALANPPAPAALIASMLAAEDTLATALAAERLAQRKLDASDLAEQRATGLLAAERDTAAANGATYSRGATLF
jgi:hypothetical protein